MKNLRYLVFDSGPWPAPSTMMKIAMKLIPNANPDFDEAYQKVTHWWLEVDEDGNVLREIGFDPEQNAIAIAPYRDNYGIFTDSGSPIRTDASEIEQNAFESMWQAAELKFAA